MNRLEEIKSDLHRGYEGDPALAVCINLIDYIAHLPEQETRQLTAKSLARGSSRPLDAEIVRAITILVSAPHPVLESKLVFIDDEGTFEDIGKDRYDQALRNGCMVHPRSGATISDYDKYVFPYFVLTDEFSKAVKNV